MRYASVAMPHCSWLHPRRGTCEVLRGKSRATRYIACRPTTVFPLETKRLQVFPWIRCFTVRYQLAVCASQLPYRNFPLRRCSTNSFHIRDTALHMALRHLSCAAIYLQRSFERSGPLNPKAELNACSALQVFKCLVRWCHARESFGQLASSRFCRDFPTPLSPSVD